MFKGPHFESQQSQGKAIKHTINITRAHSLNPMFLKSQCSANINVKSHQQQVVPFGAELGKSEGKTSFMRNTPPVYGVPSAPNDIHTL